MGAVDESVRDLAHGIQVILGVLEVLEALSVVRLDAALDEGLERPLVLVPLLNLGVDHGLGLLRYRGGSLGGSLGCRLARAGLLLGRLLGVVLPLASPGGRGGCGGSVRGGRRGRLGDGAVVVVHAPHVVPQVPLPGEAVSGDGAVATLVSAHVRLLAVAMHGVGLTLMPEEAGSGRKPGILAAFDLAAVWLEMGVHELAAGGLVDRIGSAGQPFLLVIALELLGLVVAARLALPRAVEQAVRLRKRALVEVVIPRRLTVAAQTARAKGGVGQSKGILSRVGHGVQILGCGILGRIHLAAHAAVPKSVRNCCEEQDR